MNDKLSTVLIVDDMATNIQTLSSILIDKYNSSLHLIKILLIMFIILFTFFIILLNNNFQPKNNYEDNLKTIGFLVLTFIIFYCIYYLLNQKRIYIYENYFEIKKLLQTRKYHFSEITTHFSEYFEGKYNSWTEYYLILNTGEKITLIDSEYSNFYDFFI